MGQIVPLPQSGHTHSTPGPTTADARFDLTYLYRVYVQVGGSVLKMLKLGDPCVPGSKTTLYRLEKKHKWRDRMHGELQQVTKASHEQTIADATQKRRERLANLEDAIYGIIMPKKNADGTNEWQLPPQKFEATLDKFLKLIDRIETMNGGVTSREEVKKIVMNNVTLVCGIFGRVLDELHREGKIQLTLARTINDRFVERVSNTDVVMDAEARPGPALRDVTVVVPKE